MTVSDTDLRGYLEGDLTEAEMQRIEAALEEDPDLEDRLIALDPLAPVVGDAVALMPSPDPGKVAAWTQQAPPENRRWTSLVAGVALGALIMGGASWLVSDRPDDWRTAVASYQALYAPETVAPLQFSDDALQAQLAEAEARIGTTDLYALVSDLQGLRPLRSQILAHEGAPLIQIVFATDAGLPVALCLMQAPTPQTPGSGAVEPREGLASLAFDTTSHSWLLIGTEDDALISATGAELRARLGMDI